MTINHGAECLFVYGTLMPGEANHHYLQSIEGVWEHAFARGHLYPEGTGLAKGYPVLVLDDTANRVPGWLLVSMSLHEHWPILDDFEGFAYCRVKERIQTGNNRLVEAYVYVLADESVVHE